MFYVIRIKVKIITQRNYFKRKTKRHINEKTNEETSKTLNFIDKVKTVVKSQEELLNEEYVPPGYLVLKRDKKTNKITK